MSPTAHLFKFNPYFHAILCSKCFCSCRYIRTLYKCVHSRVYTMHGGRLSQVQHCTISWCLLSGAGGTEWGIVMTGVHGPMPIHQWPDQLSVEPPLGTLHSNFSLFRKNRPPVTDTLETLSPDVSPSSVAMLYIHRYQVELSQFNLLPICFFSRFYVYAGATVRI